MAKPQATGVVKIVPTGVQKTAATIKKSFADIGKQIGQTMKVATAAAMAGAAAGIAATIKNGFDQKVILEQSETLMASLMGGADRAREAMAMLGDEARKNPMFSKKDLVQTGAALSVFAKGSSQQLQGLVETAQKLTLLKPGKGLEDAAFALKEALGGDFVSLAGQFDIPRSSIKALRDAGYEGKALIDALLKGQGITDATMAGMKGTVGAQLSAMRAMWDEISLQIVEGFWPRIQETAKEFLGWISQNKEQIVAIITTVTEAAAGLIKFLVTAGDYVMRTAQMIGAFIGGWWAGVSSNFTAENFVAWVKDVGMAGLEAARGLIFKLLELAMKALKEFAPKIFGWVGGDGLMKDIAAAADESFAASGRHTDSASERAGIAAGAREAMAEMERQYDARMGGGAELGERGKAIEEQRQRQAAMQQGQQQATLRVDVQGWNMPPMMGAS